MSNSSFINVVNNPNLMYNHSLMLEKAEAGVISYAFEIYGDGKIINDYRGNIMATAPYSFYTKEAIDRLVNVWCKNMVEFIDDKPQNKI